MLHCSEIRVRERRYVPGEPGVRAARIPAELWHLLSVEHTLEMQQMSRPQGEDAEPDMSRTPSTLSGETAYDSNGEQEESAKRGWMSPDPLDAQRRLLLLQKEALRNRVASPGREGRVILRGEPVFWSDLVAGGERAEPFDADLMLDMPTCAR